MQTIPLPPGALRLVGAAALCLVCGIAQAAYPERPLTLIVPFPAGGTVDAVARIAGTRLGTLLGTTVVIENVTGAGGTIATQRVVRANPDGYTLLFTTPNHTINPAILPKLPFDSERDLVPISLVAQIPELLVANSSQPFSDFKGFINYARSHPGKLNYASAGNGTLPHVTMELLLQKLKLQVVHIPYKGAAPAMQDLLGGQVAIKLDTIATSSPHIKSGRLKPLALASARRSPLMPEVPTIAESGVPGYQGILWMGILAPKGTDPQIIATVNKAISETIRDPDVLKRFGDDGVEAVSNTPEEFRKMIETEIRQWRDVVKAANITVN